MLTEDQIKEILGAPKVTVELAARIGVGIPQLYRIRRKFGAHTDLRFKSDAERVLRYKVSDSGCWEWTGSQTLGGYGNLGPWRGEKTAHRASYVFHKGQIPTGALVLHSCDNRLCINPDHLRLGTHSENNIDAYSRNRRPDKSGERNGNAKLTSGQVAAIRADDRTQAAIAREFGISTSLVSAIKNRTAWRTESATARAQMNLR